MKKILLTLIISLVALALQAQKDTTNILGNNSQRTFSRDMSNVNVTIYPVPVRENNFTIKTDKDVSYVRITNIIGQDIYRAQYNDPQQFIRIFLENPNRGMYLVSVIFSDGTKVVKKIMIEESD
jgi:hypothetical protein